MCQGECQRSNSSGQNSRNSSILQLAGGYYFDLIKDRQRVSYHDISDLYDLTRWYTNDRTLLPDPATARQLSGKKMISGHWGVLRIP